MKRNMLFLQSGLLFLLSGIILFGVFLVALPMAPTLREHAIEFINSSDSFLTTLGVLTIVVALLILIASYAMTKGASFTVVMGDKGSFTVDERVLNKLLHDYFKKIFNKFDVAGRFVDKEIQITLEMPSMPFVEQRPLLEKIEKELADLFEEQFNYVAPFSLSATVLDNK